MDKEDKKETLLEQVHSSFLFFNSSLFSKKNKGKKTRRIFI